MIRRSDKAQGAFTLIELLVVVAILAVLALVALPNFLEAQTRAKASRARADLRQLATATEAYRVDNIGWPFNPVFPGRRRWMIVEAYDWPQEYGLWYILTTPVSYISSIPHDPFWRRYNEHWQVWADFYRVWNLEDHPPNGWGGASTHRFWKRGGSVLMASVGPDRVEDIHDGTAGRPTMIHPGITPYDPTNGTVSWGDIYYGLPGIGFDGVWRKARP